MIVDLATADEVIAALGGRGEVAKLVGVTPTAVSNWNKQGRFASNTYALMIDALNARGRTASPALWGMKEGADGLAAARQQGAALRAQTAGIRAQIAEVKQKLTGISREIAGFTTPRGR